MTSICGHGGEPAVRKGPWTMEEDLILINHISQHGEGAWNNLARSAGLNRTGKSCRLRWLNYLKPGVRRGNISRYEDMLIRELHSTWGNRWSKIAKHLPGRTDNEIKNYWRTRIHKKPRAGNGEPRPYVHQNAVSVNEAPAASPSQLSSVEDGCVQWSYPELSMIATQQHETADVDAIPRQYFYSDFDNFWNVDGFWAAMPVLDAE